MMEGEGKEVGWKEGKGTCKKKKKREESKDQSLVWDYLCPDNILYHNHPHEDLLSFMVDVSLLYWIISYHINLQTLTHVNTIPHSLIPCIPHPNNAAGQIYT